MSQHEGVLEVERQNSAEDIEKIMLHENILIKVANRKTFSVDTEALIAYRYLMWACTRNYLIIAHHIITKHGISPFMYEKEDMRSPFLSAIENNQLLVI